MLIQSVWILNMRTDDTIICMEDNGYNNPDHAMILLKNMLLLFF